VAKKLGLVLLGLTLVAAVVWLGLQATQNASWVLWFGLGSAILVPLASSLIGHAIRMDDRLRFRQLLKVPLIESLIEEARTQEERIRLLELQREQMSEIIQVEARRQTLTHQLTDLEKRLSDVVTEHKAVTDELALIGARIEDSPVLSEARRIQKRIRARKKGRVIVVKLGGRELTFFEREFNNSLPDTLMLLFLRSLEAKQRADAAKASQGGRS
jgi:hypothetical protein